MAKPQLVGDTVYLVGTFLDTEGLPFEPDSVALEITDDRFKLIKTVDDLSLYKVGIGKFEYPFENPDVGGIAFKYIGRAGSIKNVVAESYVLTKV